MTWPSPLLLLLLLLASKLLLFLFFFYSTFLSICFFLSSLPSAPPGPGPYSLCSAPRLLPEVGRRLLYWPGGAAGAASSSEVTGASEVGEMSSTLHMVELLRAKDEETGAKKRLKTLLISPATPKGFDKQQKTFIIFF